MTIECKELGKRALLAVWAAFLLFSFCEQGTAQVQSSSHPDLKLYDSFEGRFLNPEKWSSEWQCGSSSVMECDRGIVDHKLRLYVRAYGARDSNINIQYGESQLDLSANTVTDISAHVIIRKTNSQGCTTSPGGGTHGQALIFGTYFNGGGGTANDDVQAFLQFDRFSTEPSGIVEAGGFLGYQGVFFDNVDLGPVAVGEHVIAELVWDRPNHRFIARVIHPDSGTTFEQTMPYMISDSSDAVSPLRSLSSRVFVENCTDVKTFADMDVAFDKVMTN